MTPKEPEKVRFLFTCSHTHTHMGLPFTKGDEILIEPHWASIIEAQGSGHRIQDHPAKGVTSGK
jgi:hypothetical protein